MDEIPARFIVTQAKPLREYEGEVCDFPNHVFQGWCQTDDGKDQWRTTFCPWRAGIISDLFTRHGWNLLQVLRWEYAQAIKNGDIDDVVIDDNPVVGDSGTRGRAGDANCAGSGIMAAPDEAEGAR